MAAKPLGSIKVWSSLTGWALRFSRWFLQHGVRRFFKDPKE